MGVVNLRVTPEDLDRQASAVSASVAKMKKDLARMKQTVNKTSGYWIGEAGNAHRSLYNDRAGEIDRIMQHLEEYPDQLREMAGIYRSTEQKNKQLSAPLKTNVIS